MKEEEKVMEHLVLYRSRPSFFLFLGMLVFFIIMAVILTLQKRFELSFLGVWIPILVLIGVGTIFRYSFYQDFYTRSQLYFGIFKGKEKKMNYDSLKCFEIRKIGVSRGIPSLLVHYSEKQIKSKWNLSRTMDFDFNHPELLIPLLTYLTQQTEVKIKINIDSSYRKQYKLLKPFDNFSK